LDRKELSLIMASFSQSMQTLKQS